MNNHTVECLEVGSVSPADQARMAELSELVWPAARPGGNISRQLRAKSAPPPQRQWPHTQRPRVFVVRDAAGQIIAKAGFAPREVLTRRGPLAVLALAGVLSHPQRRGEGLGAAVVRACFGLVDDGSFGCSFFQTGVPEFYDRLGGRVVDNPLINSLSPDPQERPFWDKVAMIYPASFDWPAGPIDTQGPGW
jgi:GNAT superfamily N-acetyltransferase